MERGRSDHAKGGIEPGKGVSRESRLEERRYHRVSDGVWMTLKRTLVLEEEEADKRSFLEDEDEAHLELCHRLTIHAQIVTSPRCVACIITISHGYHVGIT